VDAKLWGHKEEHVEVDASGRTARLREERICEPGDKMCNDEAIIERRETIITHEPHLHKERVGEALSTEERILEANEKLAHTRAGDKSELAGEKLKHKAREAYDSAAEAGERVKYKTKEAYDSAAEGSSHAGEKIKYKAQETYDSASEGASHAGEKIKHKAQETFDSAATGLHAAKEKIAETAHHIKAEVEEHMPNLGAEKFKHKAQEAYDSATEGVSHAGEKVKNKAQQAYDTAKEKTEYAGNLVKEKLWAEKPIVFTHPIIPGFRAWLAIFGAIGAQLLLGWAWYNLIFKKPFRQALAEDRAYKFATVGELGMTDKLSQAAHSLKDKAASSTMGQKLGHSTAAQKASQAGEMLREKIAEGRDKASQAGEMLKEKAAEGRDKLLREKDSKAKWSSTTPATATTAAPVMTQQVFSSSTPHVTTTTVPLSSAPTTIAATTTTTTTVAAAPTTVAAPATFAATTTTATSTALPKETTDAAEAAFLREKEKPLLTFEPTAGSTGEFIAGPYSAIWGPISSVLVSTIRSFFMFHWLRVLLVNSAFGALAMAFYFFFGSQFCSMHHYIWEGRPLKLLLIDQGAELAMSAATAWIVYEFGIAH